MYLKSKINTYKNSRLPEADRITDVFSSKYSIPYVKQETGTPFYIVYLMISCDGSIISYTCA